MKLIFLLVFSLDILLTLLAAEIPRHDERLVPVYSDDSLSADQESSPNGKFLRSTSGGRWRKVNSSPVCFGARSHQYGRFIMPRSGMLAAIKLVHLYGFVSCNIRRANAWSFWGCAHAKDKVNVVITNAANRIILPASQFIVSSSKWSRAPYYNAPFAPELVMPVFSHPRSVSNRQEFRVWYGEDLTSSTTDDNGGRSCTDVYALYV